MAAARQLLPSMRTSPHVPFTSLGSHSKFSTALFSSNHRSITKLCSFNLSGLSLRLASAIKAASENVGFGNEDGVSLGTMKLPADIDTGRFEQLLFQWGNSLCQGANLPLPVPLKVDKVRGGIRLGFIRIVDDGETEVFVYIDCLVLPATGGSGPMFRAVRNGLFKDQPPPGEPRIMRSLLAALQKSVEIAKI